MIDSAMSSQYRAVVPPTAASPRVALFSTSDSPQSVDIECFSDRGRGAFHRSASLGPHQMRLVSACDVLGPHQAPFEAAFRPHQRTPAAMAISVQTNAPPGSLGVWGVSGIGDRRQTEIALNFEDASSLKTQESIFAGVPIGTADLLPGDNFTPDLAVANFGNTTAHVSVIYSTIQGDSPNTKTVATLSLPARSVQHVSLSGLAGNPDLRNTFVVKSDTTPGTVIANLVLKGQDEYPAIQLMAKDPEVNNGGEHPWTIADGDRSTVLLYNCSDREQIFTMIISTGGKEWHQAYTLKPSETKSVEIGDLIRNQIADRNGAKLPANATSGAISWFTADPGEGTGRLLVSNPVTGLARNFSCGTNYVLCNAQMYSDVATFGWQLVGELGNLNGLTCLAYNPSACSGQSTGETGYGYSYNWWSNNTSIAPVSGPTNGSSASFYGQNAGTGTATGQVQSQYCQVQAPGTNNVIPTVQVSQVTLNPTSISASAPGGASTTATVQLYIPVIPSTNQTVTVSLATYSSTPSSNNVSYQAAQQITIGPGVTSPKNVWFSVTANSSTVPGSIVIAAAATNPSSGITVTAPTGTPPTASNDVTLTITQ